MKTFSLFFVGRIIGPRGFDASHMEDVRAINRPEAEAKLKRMWHVEYFIN